MQSLREVLQGAKKFIVEERGTVAPLTMSEEEMNPRETADGSFTAQALESLASTYPVSPLHDGAPSEFQFFEDGRQRTIQIGYIRTDLGPHTVLVPVHFYAVAAVILRRDVRKLSVWSSTESEKGIIVARHLLPDQDVLKKYEDSGLQIIDTNAPGNDYNQMRQRALEQAKVRRLEMEHRIMDRWINSVDSKDAFLVVDGTLMNFRNEKALERCVGVSNSFSRSYFALSDHNRIMSLPEGHRSWAFRFHAADEDTSLGARERISAYLRLRSAHQAHPEFGLIRIEVSAKHEQVVTEFINRVCSSLLAERLPTRYPRPSWHNDLYPITVCADYLASQMPSLSTIRASMKTP